MAKSLPLAFPSVLSSPPLWRAPEKKYTKQTQRATRTKLKWADYFVANLPNFVYCTSSAKGWASSMLAKSRPTELSAPYKNWWKYGRFTFVVSIFNIQTLETGFICSFLRMRCLIGVYEWNLFVLTWKSHLKGYLIRKFAGQLLIYQQVWGASLINLQDAWKLLFAKKSTKMIN